jgi:hypothetical protein
MQNCIGTAAFVSFFNKLTLPFKFGFILKEMCEWELTLEMKLNAHVHSFM